ncbi:putative uncharacterized protein [Firmicutes bacterium CAG:95]|nr:putative uncharacterized protein [Firmicutes bacterium CAG:95]
MMYIHYCKNCNRIYMLNGHKLICPRCTEPIAELRISYLDYIDLNLEQRASFLKSCADESQLCKLKTNYRMYKYSKWYKELQANNPDHLPVTTLLAQQVNGDK